MYLQELIDKATKLLEAHGNVHVSVLTEFDLHDAKDIIYDDEDNDVFITIE